MDETSDGIRHVTSGSEALDDAELTELRADAGDSEVGVAPFEVLAFVVRWVSLEPVEDDDCPCNCWKSAGGVAGLFARIDGIDLIASFAAYRSPSASLRRS